MKPRFSTSLLFINPWCACAGGLRYLVCVCVCLSVCVCVWHHESCHYAQLSVQPKVPTASAQSGLNMVFSLKCFVQKLWREKANKLINMRLPRQHMAPMERHFARNFKDGAFLVLSKSNDRLQATWHSKAASY